MDTVSSLNSGPELQLYFYHFTDLASLSVNFPVCKTEIILSAIKHCDDD